MAYIDYEYYHETFDGTEIPEDEFKRIADIASEVVYAICTVKPDEVDFADDDFKKAVCYEAEMLQEQGGVDAILGFSDNALRGVNEHLGDYSISGYASSAGSGGVATIDGIPVSPLALMMLRKLGLTAKWAYATREDYR